MKELLFSQMGFWSAFTLIFILAVMGWFFYKVMKLSKESPSKK